MRTKRILRVFIIFLIFHNKNWFLKTVTKHTLNTSAELFTQNKGLNRTYSNSNFPYRNRNKLRKEIEPLTHMLSPFNNINNNNNNRKHIRKASKQKENLNKNKQELIFVHIARLPHPFMTQQAHAIFIELR